MKWSAIASSFLLLCVADRAGAAEARDAVRADWAAQYRAISEELKQRGKPPDRGGDALHVLDSQSLVRPAHRDALDVIVRRTEALIADLQSDGKTPGLADLSKQLADIKRRAAGEGEALRESLAMEALAVRRQAALANPLLDFTDILFISRGVNYGTTKDGDHMVTAYYGFNGLKGGGLYAVKDFKSASPRVVNVLSDSKAGAYMSPELSYDGKSVFFAFTENDDRGQGVYQGRGTWLDSTCYHLFRVGVDGAGLTQLTFGPNNDFDPCLLPGGRVVFCSDRRGGMHRCASPVNDVYPEKQLSLHSMKADGSDLVPISWHETHEFQPSVDNNGMLVYTRWDYIDRCDSTGHHLWICYPDGRDPRSAHGNYPRPYSTFEGAPGGGNTFKKRVFAEWGIRAVPDSPRYIATAGPHHGQPYGSLVLIDLGLVDDDGLSQITRITPDAQFPESEVTTYDPGRLSYKYGTPWPLSESYYLCNLQENLYLLDKFGNRELICSLGEVCGKAKPWRLLNPIPVRPRRQPPTIPDATYQGERAGHRDHAKAVLGVQNVYRSDLPWPNHTRIKWLRIIQVLRKPESTLLRDSPPIGFGEEQLARICLGRVPVEADGSAYFEAPVGVPIYFQAVDQRGMAVQSMRSDTYVHPGEQLTCGGCHESKWEAASPGSPPPAAFARAASKIEPEVGGVEPVSYYRLVEPVFHRTCVVCHRKEGKGPANLDYGNPADKANPLRKLVFFQQGGFADTWPSARDGGAGGSRSIPGMFGAARSPMGQALLKPHHQGAVSEEEFRRVVLWLDCQSPALGVYTDVDAQKAGKLVWPADDADPHNPTAVERDRPVP